MEEKDFQPSDFVAQHIYSSKLSEKYEELFKAVDYEQVKPLNNVIWQIYRKEISLPDFLAKATALNLPGFKEKIFPGILRYDFLPLADYLEININEWLKYLSVGEVAKLKIVSFNKWLEGYLKERDLILEDKAHARIISILKNFIGGDDEEKTIKTLGQTEKLGGVSLAESETQKLVKALRERFEKAVEQDEIITAQEVVVPSTKNKEQRTSEKSISVPEKPPINQRSAIQPFISPIQLYDKTAEDLIKQSGLPITPELRQRFKIIVISRFKDVRKIPETREKLMADVKNGGLGLKLEEAEKMIKMIEEERLKIENLRLKIEKNVSSVNVLPEKVEEKEIKVELPAFSKPAPESLPKKTFSVIPAKAGIQSPAKIVKPGFPIKSGMTVVEQSIGRNDIKDTSDIKKTSPSALKIVSPASPVGGQAKTPPKMELAMPRPPAPKPAPISVIPQAPSGRAKMEDVAFKPRLVGPVEELKGMSLVDFRRLSPKPQVTADKIYAKIELLSEEGYDKKIMGIKAWQASPVNALYGAILNEGMEKAKPVAEVIASRQSAGQETLTPEEFKAVMELSKRLRN